jgi:hypothetical protein
VGAIGSAMELTNDEKAAIRKKLAASEVPLHLSQLASSCEIDLSNLGKQASMAHYVEGFLCEKSQEAELAFGPKPRGPGQMFLGFRATALGKKMVEKGLG